MIYAAYSWVTLTVWVMDCLLRGRFWRGVRWASYQYLESPGTKVYTIRETRQLFQRFSSVTIRRQLAHGDLLLVAPSRRYQGKLAQALWRLYPRWLVRLMGNSLGTSLLIEATK